MNESDGLKCSFIIIRAESHCRDLEIKVKFTATQCQGVEAQLIYNKGHFFCDIFVSVILSIRTTESCQTSWIIYLAAEEVTICVTQSHVTEDVCFQCFSNDVQTELCVIYLCVIYQLKKIKNIYQNMIDSFSMLL